MCSKFALGLVLGLLLCGADAAFPQVSPAEISNPRLKAVEQTYFTQLVAMNRAIAEMNFPFKFAPSRYAGLDPKEQAAADRRGLEFVLFHDRLMLKVSGNYNAAFNTGMLTRNERANRVLDDVIVPVLRLVPRYFPNPAGFDAYGFEISYHVRTQNGHYDYEGKEVLVLVFDKDDVSSYLNAPDEAGRQEIVNRSEVYVSGEQFGLALGRSDPLEVESLDKSRPLPSGTAESPPAAVPEAPPTAATPPARRADPDRNPLQTGRPLASVDTSHREVEASLRGAAPAQPEVDALQSKYQLQLDALAKEGMERFHFVDYAPPSFVIVRNHPYLQLTLRNPNSFDRNATSIYKRAAQSFDLFLAPLLKPILDKVPGTGETAGIDISVINKFAPGNGVSSEAVEFAFPLRPLRQFADAEITNQDLINQSLVLVNGVRIALNLQQVE